MVNLNTFVW